jgi:hypothetical protein
MWITRNGLFPGGFFRPLELIGSLWYGTIANGASAGLLGVATLLGSSVILGLVWAYVFSYVKVEPLVTGVALGAILGVIMQQHSRQEGPVPQAFRTQDQTSQVRQEDAARGSHFVQPTGG